MSSSSSSSSSSLSSIDRTKMANHVFACDRRLSRAARELIRRRVVPLLLSSSSSSSSSSHQQHTLEEHIVSVPSTSCILHPKRDMLLSQEEQSYPIPAGSSSSSRMMMIIMTPPTTSSSKNKKSTAASALPKQHWWQCGLCGKIFLTRYYLDLHLETKHTTTTKDEDLLRKDVDDVCLATDICPILGGGSGSGSGGGGSCEEMALELEPYYGRGGGYSSPFVRHYWARMAHSQSCNETFLRTDVQPACRQVFHECFASDVAHELSVGVCDTFTCHNRLYHHLAGHFVQHVYMWKDEWDAHHNHTVSWTGLFVILSVMIYYCCRCGDVWQRSRGRRPTTQLLSKKPTSSTTTTLSKWRMFRQPSKVKRH